ncbi:MAG: endonuclease MutS2 [Eubacteriales bacterium]|nr:endonuclease MutS2 [Eubacteriales bacterium]
MNRKALRILDYNKIKDLLADEAGCEMSRRMARRLRPMSEIRDIENALRSTTEAVDLLAHKGALPCEGIYDIRDILSLSEKGSILSMRQLLQVHTDLAIASQVVHFLKGDVPEMPHIMEIAELITEEPELEREIDRCIVSEDEMADDASRELRRIRGDIRKESAAIRTRLERIIGSSTNRLYLQDAIVTMRDGRYVIPVKSEHRQKFPGIVHDQSKGGQTLFIEPQVIIDMNNELRELGLAEEAEIQRILESLSNEVGGRARVIRNNQELLTELDFIMAKAKLSSKMNGEEPKLSQEGKLSLVQARHPLLDPRKAVPVTVSLGDDFHTLVITGPNTGGKTLTLKTVGLLSLMALSGMHIPASSESVIPVYQDIFADIGDEQSIEQSLSTFSAHMKNTVYIIEHARENTLVLLDELGAGTDPTEGAAIGIAILEQLLENGVCTLATTHYNEIKKYALSTKDVENASMEFDVESLRPTYRLLIGVPGKSNAFAISKRLGLPDAVIRRAETFLDQGDVEFDDLMASIEADRRAAEKDRETASRLQLSAKERAEETAKAEKELQKKKEEILRNARHEAREIVRDAERTAKDVRKELRSLSKEESLGERNKRMKVQEERLRKKEEQYQEPLVQRVNSNPVRAGELKVGDRVKVLTLGANGEIITLPDEKGELTVRAGIAKVKVHLSDLTLLNDGSKKARKKKTVSSSYAGISKSMSVSPRIDVRGENLDDARMDVEKYLDDVSLSGLKEVTVIHGRGEGILKDGLRRYFRTNRHIASFRPGAYNEGGEGVTIITMR